MMKGKEYHVQEMIVVDHKQIINQESITEVRASIINSLIVILMDA